MFGWCRCPCRRAAPRAKPVPPAAPGPEPLSESETEGEKCESGKVAWLDVRAERVPLFSGPPCRQLRSVQVPLLTEDGATSLTWERGVASLCAHAAGEYQMWRRALACARVGCDRLARTTAGGFRLCQACAPAEEPAQS